MKDFSKVPLNQIVNLMIKAMEENNQELVNELALETAERLYIPNPNKTREEFLAEFGYKEIEKEIQKEKKK